MNRGNRYTKWESDSTVITGWKLDPRDVRRIASKVGLPTDAPIPTVLVSGEAETARRDRSTEGELIVIPGGAIEIEPVPGEGGYTYKLGTRANDYLRHELVHYREDLQGDFRIGDLGCASEDAAREIRVELTGRTSESKSRYLFYVMVSIRENYGLTPTGAIRIVRREATKQGLSSRVITRAENLAKRYWKSE